MMNKNNETDFFNSIDLSEDKDNLIIDEIINTEDDDFSLDLIPEELPISLKENETQQKNELGFLQEELNNQLDLINQEIKYNPRFNRERDEKLKEIMEDVAPTGSSTNPENVKFFSLLRTGLEKSTINENTDLETYRSDLYNKTLDTWKVEVANLSNQKRASLNKAIDEYYNKVKELEEENPLAKKKRLLTKYKENPNAEIVNPSIRFTDSSNPNKQEVTCKCGYTHNNPFYTFYTTIADYKILSEIKPNESHLFNEEIFICPNCKALNIGNAEVRKSINESLISKAKRFSTVEDEILIPDNAVLIKNGFEVLNAENNISIVENRNNKRTKIEAEINLNKKRNLIRVIETEIKDLLEEAINNGNLEQFKKELKEFQMAMATPDGIRLQDVAIMKLKSTALYKSLSSCNDYKTGLIIKKIRYERINKLIDEIQKKNGDAEYIDEERKKLICTELRLERDNYELSDKDLIKLKKDVKKLQDINKTDIKNNEEIFKELLTKIKDNIEEIIFLSNFDLEKEVTTEDEDMEKILNWFDGKKDAEEFYSRIISATSDSIWAKKIYAQLKSNLEKLKASQEIKLGSNNSLDKIKKKVFSETDIQKPYKVNPPILEKISNVITSEKLLNICKLNMHIIENGLSNRIKLIYLLNKLNKDCIHLYSDETDILRKEIQAVLNLLEKNEEHVEEIFEKCSDDILIFENAYILINELGYSVETIFEKNDRCILEKLIVTDNRIMKKKPREGIKSYIKRLDTSERNTLIKSNFISNKEELNVLYRLQKIAMLIKKIETDQVLGKRKVTFLTYLAAQIKLNGTAFLDTLDTTYPVKIISTPIHDDTIMKKIKNSEQIFNSLIFDSSDEFETLNKEFAERIVEYSTSTKEEEPLYNLVLKEYSFNQPDLIPLLLYAVMNSSIESAISDRFGRRKELDEIKENLNIIADKKEVVEYVTKYIDKLKDYLHLYSNIKNLDEKYIAENKKSLTEAIEKEIINFISNSVITGRIVNIEEKIKIIYEM